MEANGTTGGIDEIDAELIERVARALDVDTAAATRVYRAAEPLWNELEALGLVDSFGGMECRRVLPEALVHIHRIANRGPRESAIVR